MKDFPEIRRYYARQWYVIPLLPFFNLLVFFIRFAGIINSINTDSAWKVRNFTEEKKCFKDIVKKDFAKIFTVLSKIRKFVNVE